MSKDFRDVMSKHTDEELIKIVTLERDSYQSAALESAEEEIKKRNISAEIIEEVKIDLTRQIEIQKEFNVGKVSLLKRFIHLVIDSIAFLILTQIFVSIITPYIITTDLLYLKVISYLVTVAAIFCYYVFMETIYQKTIGKFITNTKVVMKDGSKPKLGDILTRTCCRLIPFDQLSYLFSADGFHDKFSETKVIIVVDDEEEEEED